MNTLNNRLKKINEIFYLLNIVFNQCRTRTQSQNIFRTLKVFFRTILNSATLVGFAAYYPVYKGKCSLKVMLDKNFFQENLYSSLNFNVSLSV